MPFRCREEAYQAGEKLSAAEVQRRVITEAKTTDARAWLCEVASVALVQSVRDAHRAFANFVDSMKGRRRGRRVGKPRRKVAIQHSKVARARLDYHHKQALHLVRENQAVYVEDLNIAGMVRNRRLARAIHDAGWSQFVRLLQVKAERYGRTVHTVDRWLPSSKTCSDCGHVVGEMPPKIREWACPGCGTRHDRDHNAARNILAAGRAERLNACGADVGPPLRGGHR